MNAHNSIKTLEPKMSVPAAPSAGGAAPGSPRPVKPFALNCRFDRSRGEFVVHAGARAGGLAIVAVALLGVGALGFLADAIRGGSPRPAAPAVAMADAEPPFVTAAPEHSPFKKVQPDAPRAKSSKKKQSGQSAAKTKKSLAKKPAKAAQAEPAHAGAPQPNVARRAGLNYLVLRSFPNAAEAAAARDALGAKGVQTTVERNLPGWAGKGWHSLVGTTGFDMDRQRGDFDRHVKSLKAMKLDPKPYRWRGAEVVTTE